MSPWCDIYSILKVCCKLNSAARSREVDSLDKEFDGSFNGKVHSECSGPRWPLEWDALIGTIESHGFYICDGEKSEKQKPPLDICGRHSCRTYLASQTLARRMIN